MEIYFYHSIIEKYKGKNYAYTKNYSENNDFFNLFYNRNHFICMGLSLWANMAI
ncbi:Hypothetical protein GbCGDNIH7_7022 [Granulibacter bethesdensis]|nr:Hypothetical protein GbCGDNIH7_7022 [Granulibacter bethesdensis]